MCTLIFYINKTLFLSIPYANDANFNPSFIETA